MRKGCRNTGAIPIVINIQYSRKILMKNFENVKKNELQELLDDPELMELFEHGDIINEFEVDSKNAVTENHTGYDKDLKIY